MRPLALLLLSCLAARAAVAQPRPPMENFAVDAAERQALTDGILHELDTKFVFPERLAAHRAELVEMTRRLGWSFLVHHTDRSPSEPLLSLIMRMASGAFIAEFHAMFAM